MTKDQRKAVLANFVAGLTPEAIALALDIPLSDVQSAVQREPNAETAPDAPIEPESEFDTPERRAARQARQAAAKKQREIEAAERARWGTDKSRRDAAMTRSGGGVQVIGTGYGAGALVYARPRRVF